MGLLHVASLALAALLGSLCVCQGFVLPARSPSQGLSTTLHFRDRAKIDSLADLAWSNCDDIFNRGVAQSIFDKWDTDKKGELDSSQLRQIVSEIFPNAIWNERAMERLASEAMNKSLIDFEDFYTWLNLQAQAQTESLVDKTGTWRHVVSHGRMKELAKHFDNGSSHLRVKDISYDAIQEIIDVSKPYYALENERMVINESDEVIGLVAEVSPEMPATYEAGAMGLAETCRHLAIAGSVAAAIANPKKGKHYYLALDGFTRYNEVLPNSLHDSIDMLLPAKPGKLRLFAYSVSAGKREATSEAFLYTGNKNDDIIRINVTYKIIPTNLFQRFYPPVTTEHHMKGLPLEQLTPKNIKNPYEDEVDISIEDIKNMDNGCMLFSTSIPPVCPSKCAGHFDTSPCLPIAFLLGHLVSAAGQSVANLFVKDGIPAPPSLVAKDGILKATKLVQAGTAGLKIKGKTTQIKSGVYEIAFDVYDDDGAINNQIAFFEFTLQQT